MWTFRKKPFLPPGVANKMLAILDDGEKKELQPEKAHIFVPNGVMAQLVANGFKTFDDITLMAHGLKACCEKHDFDMPQPILDALLRVLKATQASQLILKIVLEENGVKATPEEMVN